MRKSAWTAIFDLDGTLIPHTSAEKTFFFYLFRNKLLSLRNVFQLLSAIWTAHGSLHDMTLSNKGYLRNKSVTTFQEIAKNYFEPRIDSLIFPIMFRVIKKHQQNGDLILLLTGTLDIIAKCFVRHLLFDGYRATVLEHKNGFYTGKTLGIQPYGIGKLETLRDLKKEFHFERDKTILYANIYSDRYVMNSVEKPVAVNPDQKLRKYACRSGWSIIEPSPQKVIPYP